MHNLMGRIVVVNKVLRRHYSVEDVRSWEASDAGGRPGWVVGERWLQVGSVDYDHDYGHIWTPRKGRATHCLLVCYWPSMRSVKVPDDGYEIAPKTIYPYVTPQPWPEDSRELMRKEMSDWPRDAKGCWVRKERT